jgi:hypothetical protein
LTLSGGVLQITGVLLLIVPAWQIRTYLKAVKTTVLAQTIEVGTAMPLAAMTAGESLETRVSRLEDQVFTLRQTVAVMPGEMRKEWTRAIDSRIGRLEENLRKDLGDLRELVTGGRRVWLKAWVLALISVGLIALGVALATIGALMA